MKTFWNDLRLVLAEVHGRALERIREAWRYRVEKARLWKSHRDIYSVQPHDDQMYHELMVKHDELQEGWKALRIMETRAVRREASKLGVELPDETKGELYGMVEWDSDPEEPYYLTDKGMLYVADAIRKARKERRDEVAFKFGLIVGGLGAVTGLLSVLFK